MATSSPPEIQEWTAADLLDRFGPIPLSRIRFEPAPGKATEQDAAEIHDREERLYELVDGVLVEKTVGFYESYLATLLVQIVGVFVRENNLGIVLGADGMIRLAPGLVRIPDVAFVSWGRLPKRRLPRDPVPDLVPDLAIEVISKGNTAEEMDRKLRDYFSAGVHRVWYVYPDRRQVAVYTGPGRRSVLAERDSLRGDAVLPGFQLPLEQLFAEPKQKPQR